MIQMILDVAEQAVALPESKNGGYTIKEETLSESIQMISGRTVREYRGKVRVGSYQSGYFNHSDMQRIIAACEKGTKQSTLCSVLTHANADLITTNFIVTSFERPKFMWSRIVTESGEEKSVPMWADFSVSLREVKPHARHY